MSDTAYNNKDRHLARYGVLALVALLIAVPRFALLFNAPSAERVPDTYIHEVLALGEAATSGRLPEFIFSVHKYPLLGPYLAVPVIGAYYLTTNIAGLFENPAELADAYMLGKTRLPLLFRMESLVFNLLALFLIFKTAQRFSPDFKHSGMFALLAASVSFYVTVFSVSPRIHNLVFLFSALTLFLSLRYYYRPSFGSMALAFGGAGLAFSAAQSGLPAVVMPLTAIFLVRFHSVATLHASPSTFLKKAIDSCMDRVLLRHCAIGLFIFTAVSLLLGYPGALSVLARGDLAGLPQMFLSSEHSDPSFSVVGLVILLRNWFFALEFVWLWPLVAFSVLVLARKWPCKLQGHDALSLVHIGAFLAIFGTSSVTVGRFGLAVLPSLFFFSSRITSRLFDRRWFALPLVAFFVLQLAVTVALSRAALNGDTRQEAAAFLVEQTSPTDRIAANVPRHALGIMATPESIRRQGESLSRTDAYVLRRKLVAEASRYFYYWNPTTGHSDAVSWKSFSFVVVREPVHELPSLLFEEGFALATEFLPHRAGLSPVPEDFNWDFFGEGSALTFFRLNRFGPAIYIFKKAEL